MGKNNEKGVVPIIALVLVLLALGIFAVIYYKSTYQAPAIPTFQTSLLQLTLESPNSGTITVNNKILVKGKTSPNATVVIYTDENENSVEADLYGNFEGEIMLAGGINTLTVTAFAENGDEKTLALDVVNDSSN
ncbi:hypothetical protein A3F00_04770 [Candidatus Daviesbacteria bacterium RIFCSPHIGHO2_12_FULL_37_11]|uniref:Archaeal Type IV pilin N-terminal domain-containing protein n=1 Tax=Candidatus Daviesbacteria bacterium RIFCSPHIGHO2_12_FULL_37_11 TaxID=1797777 RepID=A0A1F5KAW0_9BACT|nr:MAG: hypothetical protein A2769_01665 [Candidatus Daviesbacteria bacterium RIFCSPHIGHO2_01_FULL_37_27]OGE38082.1 MAG: hypothetical protein A3F00_04770 [Candidatus Daviesbacteria bacterium RIFCSPHIGHO2_12_FULL_37_11]OGE44936.1 MAG: hypothetical protein A3B39_02460 [Candidatus Daviesbacteria bacterium RIFCSPLOWO2_01_FULL_37_10]